MTALSADDSSPAKPRPNRTAVTAWAVFLLALAVYNANLRVVGPTDSFSARFLPFSIWKTGRLDLEPVIDAALQRTTYAYWMYPMRDGRRASLFPIVTPVV